MNCGMMMKMNMNEVERNERIFIRTLDIAFCIIHIYDGLFDRLLEWKESGKRKQMTIQEKAIEQLERVSNHLAAIGEKEDYTEIAIQALEQEPCEDAISRRA